MNGSKYDDVILFTLRFLPTKASEWFYARGWSYGRCVDYDTSYHMKCMRIQHTMQVITLLVAHLAFEEDGTQDAFIDDSYSTRHKNLGDTE